MDYTFRLAKAEELPKIWQIMDKAITKRKMEGSNQWQDGYPNKEILLKDIAKNAAYVLADNNVIAAYCAISINDEPEYDNIHGKWLSNKGYVVFHRLAVAEDYLGKGLATKCLEHIYAFAIKNNINSIKADTNFDNEPVLHLFQKLNYKYCGKVYFRGSERLAFEKLLK